MTDSSSSLPLRVLHVVGAMRPGGVETWLLHLSRYADRSKLAMDFLVHTDKPAAYDAELLALGARILRCPPAARPLSYAKQMWRALRESGPYDIVHSHVYQFSGWALTIAALAGVPVRIAHSHLDARSVDGAATLSRRPYQALMQLLLRSSATAAIAASTEAGTALFGESWPRHMKWSLLRCGVDLAAFHQPPRPALREELGIPRGSFVVGHIGRFEDQKNHAFLIPIAQAAQKLSPDIHFLLVGDGPLRPDIERRVVEAGLSNRFTFAGIRRDVAPVMSGAMDVFLLPSLYEGLPLVLIEAQAAGLPCLVSDTVSPESNIVNRLYFPQSLSASPQEWAAKLASLKHARTDVSRKQALSTVEASPFEVHTNLQTLQAFYLEQSNRSRSPTSSSR